MSMGGSAVLELIPRMIEIRILLVRKVEKVVRHDASEAAIRIKPKSPVCAYARPFQEDARETEPSKRPACGAIVKRNRLAFCSLG
jgi:hypothetical protein